MDKDSMTFDEAFSDVFYGISGSEWDHIAVRLVRSVTTAQERDSNRVFWVLTEKIAESLEDQHITGWMGAAHRYGAYNREA